MQAFQRKCLIFPSTGILQNFFQKPLSSMLAWGKFSAESWASHNNLYPVLTEYFPDCSRGQINTSSCGVEQRGRALIRAALGGWKQRSISWIFHLLEGWLMSSETVASGWSSLEEEDETPFPFGSHLSLKILICWPSPTLHLAPASIKCLDFMMLCHA